MEEIVDLWTNWKKLHKYSRFHLYFCLAQLLMKQENPITVTRLTTNEMQWNNDHILLAKCVYYLHSATQETKNKFYSIYNDYKSNSS